MMSHRERNVFVPPVLARKYLPMPAAVRQVVKKTTYHEFALPSGPLEEKSLRTETDNEFRIGENEYIPSYDGS